MPILLVPPTQVIPYDAERLARDQKVMTEFRAEAVKLWNANAGAEEKFGAFRRSRDYNWGESFDGLLQTFFIFPSLKAADSAVKSRSELARIAVLLRKDTCQILGSSIEWGRDWASSLPVGLKGLPLAALKDAPSRKFDTLRSPVRLSIESSNAWAPALAWLSEAFIAARLVTDGLIVHSDLSGLACFKERAVAEQKAGGEATQAAGTDLSKNSVGVEKKSTENLLKRGHRQIKVKIEGIRPNPPQIWPLMAGQFSIISLPFNSKLKTIPLASDKQTPFDPQKVSLSAGDEILKWVQPLRDKAIKITQRTGRFVIVERGLAYGLKIGMHLTGPDGARLHVIRFEPSSQWEDAAVLMIREESDSKPLAAGAVLEIDGRQYPTMEK
jgi:hypothetical protein